MDNLLPYSGLVDAKIRASDKDLPVPLSWKIFNFLLYQDFSFMLSGSTIPEYIAIMTV